MTVPGWVKEWWPWIPERDANGHSLGPGQVNLSFVHCAGCPATTDGRGHHSAKCRINGCDAPRIFPPGHVGDAQPQR